MPQENDMTQKRDSLTSSYNDLLSKVQSENSKWDGADMPEESMKAIKGWLGQIDNLKMQIDLIDRQIRSEEFLEESRGSVAVSHGWREATKDEGNYPVDEKSWREVEVRTGHGAFAKTLNVRYHVPLAVQAKDYPYAFEAYIRKGFSELGPNDQKTLREGVDNLGGFLVPPDTLSMMIKKVATIAVVRQYARVLQTSRDRIQIPRRNYTADNKYTSAVRVTWTGELPASSSAHRASDLDYGMLDIPVHTVMASLPLSIDLIQDSAYDVEREVTDAIGEAFALDEEDMFWNGSGAGRPMGILHDVGSSNGLSTVISGDASTLTADGLINLIYDIPSQYEANMRLFWRKATELAVRILKNATTDEYVWPVEERVGGFGVPERTIQGVPITKTEFVDAIGAGNYPVVVGDLKGYAVVDRVGLSIQRVVEPYAEQNLIVLLGKKRVGGQLVEPWRLRAQVVST